MPKRRSPLVFFSLIALAGLIALASGIWYGVRHPPRSPDITGLREALQKTAEQGLPAPAVARMRLEVSATPDTLAAEAARIKSVAEELGGTALQSDRNGAAELLVQLPARHSAAFAECVTGTRPATTARPGVGPDETEYIDVVVTPTAQ